MPFMTAAVLLGTTAATTATVASATFVGATTTWGLGAITTATIAADAALVSGAVGVLSSVAAGKQAEALGKSQQSIEAYNAMLDKREAEEGLDVAGFEEAKHRKAAEKLKARQRVGFAKAGITPEGTPMDVLEETAIQLETDALTISRRGEIGARRLTASSQLRKFAGRSALLRGRARRRASNLEAVSRGVGTLGQGYYNLSRLES